MHRKRAFGAMIPMMGLTVLYLYSFWHRRLAYFGLNGLVLPILLTMVCVGMVVYHPIPIKIRTICVLYLMIFGILADGLNLIMDDPVWKMLYGSGVAVFLCIAGMLLVGLGHGKKVVCQRYEVHLNKEISRPLKIGLLSDIHMGLCVSCEKLDWVCKALEEERLDLLLLAGDLFDDQTSRKDMYYAAQRIGQIPAPMGKFFVFGNHDLGSHGPALQYTENELRQALADANIRLLDDESVVTDDFILIGRRDIWMAQRWGGRKSVAQLLPEDTQSKPILVLDHQPHNAKEAAQAGADLQFSGHTHAGQVWPASWLGRLSPTFYGLHWFGNMALVVSSGLGGRGSRLRSGCSAEYVILHLNIQ